MSRLLPRSKERIPRAMGGFSLPELMVVLAIIMLLAVISIPRYTKTIAKAEEAAAAATLRNVHTSQEAHRVVHGSYASNFRALQQQDGAPVVPEDGETGGGSSGEDIWVHNGYIYRLYRPNPLEYSLTAEPIRDRDSMQYFAMDTFGYIRPGDRPSGPGSGGGGEPPPPEPPPENPPS